MRRTTRIRSLSMLAALVVALGGFPGTASADLPVSHSGRYGPHGLIDSVEFPGATCHYDESDRLARIRVRWPHVEGYSWTSTSRDYQKVSWRAKVYRDDGSGFQHYATTPLIIAHTHDDRAAYWPSQTYRFPKSVAPSGNFRVDVFMYWYHPDPVVRGTAIHRLENMRHLWSGATFDGPTCFAASSGPAAGARPGLVDSRSGRSSLL